MIRNAVATAALALLAATSVTGASADDATPAACTDFEAYANRHWHAGAVLPPDRARIGSFDTLRIGSDRVLEAALADLVGDAGLQSTPGLKLLARYYRSGTDLAGIEARGLRSLAPWLDRIDAVERAQLPALIGELARAGIAAPVAMAVRADRRDMQRHVLYLQQGGLGLPDRDDYLRDDESARAHRAAYRRYLARLFEAADGKAASEVKLDALMAFETALAKASSSRVQLRNPEANHHPQTLAGLQATTAAFDWAAWLRGYSGRDAAGIPLVLGQPAFAIELARLASEAPIETWRSYLRARVLDATAEHLPARFAEAEFDFRERALRGIAQPPRRASTLVKLIGGPTGSRPLGQTLGELYVTRAFPAEAQARALAMVDDIRAAMRARIAKLAWMSEATRAQAIAKLDAMVPKIGAPREWPRYDGLVLADDDFAGNLLRVNQWAAARDIEDLSRPVDRARWNTSPHIVNAFAGGGNQIVFPAAILQPPFFDAAADDASNYGAIGAVIGHEISHHFDDSGRRYDALGNLRDWWAAADAAAYRQRADRLAAFYSRFEPLPGLRINGQQMLGENISDLAGLEIAYDALQLAMERHRRAGKPLQAIDGITPEQRFFLANATIWRSKQRDEATALQLRTGVHSPGRFRVLGVVTQMDAFARAFNCRKGDAMVAEDPIRIW